MRTKGAPLPPHRSETQLNQNGGGSRTRTYEGLASGFTVRPLCRSGHSPTPDPWSECLTGRGSNVPPGLRVRGASYGEAARRCQHEKRQPGRGMGKAAAGLPAARPRAISATGQSDLRSAPWPGNPTSGRANPARGAAGSTAVRQGPEDGDDAIEPLDAPGSVCRSAVPAGACQAQGRPKVDGRRGVRLLRRRQPGAGEQGCEH